VVRGMTAYNLLGCLCGKNAAAAKSGEVFSWKEKHLGGRRSRRSGCNKVPQIIHWISCCGEVLS